MVKKTLTYMKAAAAARTMTRSAFLFTLIKPSNDRIAGHRYMLCVLHRTIISMAPQTAESNRALTFFGDPREESARPAGLAPAGKRAFAKPRQKAFAFAFAHVSDSRHRFSRSDEGCRGRCRACREHAKS